MQNKVLQIVGCFGVHGGTEQRVMNFHEVLKVEGIDTTFGAITNTSNNIHPYPILDIPNINDPNFIEYLYQYAVKHDIGFIELHHPEITPDQFSKFNLFKQSLNNKNIYIGIAIHGLNIDREILKSISWDFVFYNSIETQNELSKNTATPYQILLPHAIYINDAVKLTNKKYALLISRLDIDKLLSIENFIEYCLSNNIDFKIAGESMPSNFYIKQNLIDKYQLPESIFTGHIDTIPYLQENAEDISFVGGVGQVILEASSLGMPCYIASTDGPTHHVGFMTVDNYEQLMQTNFTGRQYTPTVQTSYKDIHTDSKYNTQSLTQKFFNPQNIINAYKSLCTRFSTITQHIADEHQKFDNQYIINFDDLKREDCPIGLSAYIRTRDEAHFLPTCIDSIIDWVDELIVVYNNCTDNTKEILDTYQQRYPNKIKVHHYEPEVYPARTLEHAITHPNSPHSLAHLSNFALSKTSFRYTLKMDTDHMNFSTAHKIIYKAIHAKSNIILNFVMRLINMTVKIWISINYNIKHKKGSISFRKRLQNLYIYSTTYLYKDSCNLAMSGINIGYIQNEGFFTFDSYPIVGNGDYGILLRNKGIYGYFPNYEQYYISDDMGEHQFLGYTFWHGRYAKRDYLWNTLKNRYNQFHDSDNTYIPWWQQKELVIPSYPPYTQNEEYIPIPKKEKIKVEELQNDFAYVYSQRDVPYPPSYDTFLGIDICPNPKKYQAIRDYITANNLNPQDFKFTPLIKVNYFKACVRKLLVAIRKIFN